jgi:hypothetical protein
MILKDLLKSLAVKIHAQTLTESFAFLFMNIPELLMHGIYLSVKIGSPNAMSKFIKIQNPLKKLKCDEKNDYMRNLKIGIKILFCVNKKTIKV